MSTAYLALGANLGKRQTALRAALTRLQQLPQTRVTAVADFRETEAVDAPPGSPAFINSAAALETTLSPRELLHHFLEIERSLGRRRVGQALNAPRTIDLDLLMVDDLQLVTPELTLPHPRMHLRRFVLEPLAQIAPDAIHPIKGKTIRQLLAELSLPQEHS